MIHNRDELQKAVLPLKIQVYKGVNPLEAFSFNNTIFKCIQGNADYIERSKKAQMWFSELRNSQLKSEKPIDFPYPAPLRIRSGKPIQGDFLESHGICTQSNEYTRNFCTFQHSSHPEEPATMVLDQEELGVFLKPGLYNATMTITPNDIFTTEREKSKYMVRLDISVVIEINVTIREYLSPIPDAPELKKKARVKESSIYKKLPSNLKEFIDDFTETFNI
jgi:hypothetical protein